MIRTLIDYMRLRKMGISPLTAWQIAYKPTWKIEIVIFSIVIIAFFLALAKNAIADSELTQSELKWQAIEAKLNASQYLALANKYEMVLIACLNNQSAGLDGIDRPCKFGEFKNGREVF